MSNHNSRKQSQPQNPKQGKNPPSVGEIYKKLMKVPCSQNHRHGPYDFICTIPNSQCEKLVCMDCLKKSPEHFQVHSEKFLRLNEYLELLAQPPLPESKMPIVNNVKKMESKYRYLLNNYDRYVMKEVKHIKDFFENIKERLIELVTKRVKKTCYYVVDEFKKNVEFEKGEVKNILNYSESVTKFADKGHLIDLDEILTNYDGNSKKLREKLKQTIEISHKYERIITDWNIKLQSFGKLPDQDLKPRIDLSRLHSHISKKTQDLNEILISLLPTDFAYIINPRHNDHQIDDIFDESPVKHGRKKSESERSPYYDDRNNPNYELDFSKLRVKNTILN